MMQRVAFLTAGLVLALIPGASATDSTSVDQTVGVVAESVEPVIKIEAEESVLTATEVEPALSESSESDLMVVRSELADMEPSALPRESLDLERAVDADQAFEPDSELEAP